ncbi:MAG: FAD-dependent thymidylate synthase [Candidatus Delongbacteria bacterium]
MTPAERLAPFVTNLDRPVYALHGLPPEVVAVLFAQVSRSPAGFRENLLKLMDEDGLPAPAAQAGFDQAKASAFHEKWVLGYGHSSVAEHADLHFAVEGLSILAAKALEDSRLAAFTEKSSRYQVFDLDHFHWPQEWCGAPQEEQVRRLVGDLFETYGRFYREIRAELEQERERPAGLPARAWQQTLHAAACDTTRYLLPAGARTSLGLSCNARSAAHLIRKLRAHALQELRELGDRLEEEGRRITPVLLKHARPAAWQAGLEERLDALLPSVEPAESDPPRVRLLEWDDQAAVRVVADWLVQRRGVGVGEARSRAEELGVAGRATLLHAVLDSLGEHEVPPRAFEQVQLSVEFCLDYGAFRDLQRHRLLTPTVPLLGCRWGWELPAGLLGKRREESEQLLERAAGLWRDLSTGHAAAAAYLVPMAFRQRFVLRMNLREAEHLIRLRSGVAGHPSYRSAAQELHTQLSRALPELAGFLRVHHEPAEWAREGEQRRAELRRPALGGGETA